MEKTNYEDVKDITNKEYFKGNQFSIGAFEKKYALFENEKYVDALKRVCDAIASVEATPDKRKYWSERWFSEIYNDWWHPAGSIMQGANSGKNISLANCSTVSLGNIDENNNWDSLEGLIRGAAYDVAKMAAYRQGLGVDFSAIRPKGLTVENSSRNSSGSIHWMKFIDSIGNYVGQLGRRPALLFSISCKHPDVIDFIKVKSDYTQIQNANISVQCTEEFYDAVEKDEDWTLEFTIPGHKIGQKIYLDNSVSNIDALSEIDKDTNLERKFIIAKRDRESEIITKKVKARELLALIAKNMHANAEPGIQNIDLARKYSNSDAVDGPNKYGYSSKILSTNACSEQYLSRSSLCVLSSINMGKFSTDRDTYIKELEVIGESINHFLDNVNEYELINHTYATPHQKHAIELLRRTGAGITNLCAWLFKQNLNYDDKQALDKVEDFMKWYNYFLYLHSEKNGFEKGSFGLFNSEKWKSALFVKRVIEESIKINEEKGYPILTGDAARNVTCSSIAPTGSLSLMMRDSVMSYGVEPAFFIYYWKRTRITGKYEYYFCISSVVREILENKGISIPSETIKDDWNGTIGKEIARKIEEIKHEISFKEATQINPLDKLELMSRLMKWVDSSISVTYLLPENSSWEDTYNFIIEAHKKGVKSIAAFPDRKMYGIVSSISFKDLAYNLISSGIEIDSQNFSDEELKELNISRENIHKTNNAPKRLESLEADVYSISVKGEKLLIVVGLQNGVPYEIFGGKAENLNFKQGNRKGIITKVKAGVYTLEIGDIIVKDFSKQFTPTEQILFRLASTSLRHGIPIKYIVEQLNKATDDITSIGAAAARVLKKYIKDGEIVNGQSCPSCNSNSLTYNEGCITCICGWSKCS